MVKFIVEHMDPRLWKWSLIEYTHISKVIGKQNLIFTNITHATDRKKLQHLGKVYADSIKVLKFPNACILDPTARKTLSVADRKFSYIILGGVLGDFPPRRRTKKELTQVLGYPARNLNKYQMSTNTAAYVAWKILHGTSLNKITFRKKLVVKINDSEEVILPYRFVEEQGRLVLPDGYIELIKKKR